MDTIFLKNKYTTWYYNIINYRQLHAAEGYVEKHHIIPKSLGGINSSSNIVSLTAKEHYICHLLLTKMTESENKSKMLMAYIAMSSLHSKKHKRKKISSRLFETIRKEALTNSYRIEKLRQMNSKENNPFYKKTHTDISKQKMRKAKKGKYLGEDNHFYGKTHSVEALAEISESSKNRVYSKEQLETRANSVRERYKDPELRKKISQIMKDLCQDPEYRKKRGWKPIERKE